jgi:hypothetical protein
MAGGHVVGVRALTVAALAGIASFTAARAGPPAGAASAPPPRVEHGVASALEKLRALETLRPDDPVPAARAIDLIAARGECESAQIAVRAARGLGALGAEARPLRGARPLAVAL